MIGPAWIDWTRIATPHAQSRNADVDQDGERVEPDEVDPVALDPHPATNATPVTTTAVISQRTSAPSA